MPAFERIKMLPFETKSFDAGTGELVGVASTPQVDRMGEVVSGDAMREAAERYMRNPVITWQHDTNEPIGRGLGVGREDEAFEALRVDFLGRYEAAMCVHTRLFEGMAELLDGLDARGIAWGVVSNKVERYVRPILADLGVLHRSISTVGGDTTAHAKPHPEPLLHAARLARVDPLRCVYIGDDERDIEAGRAAGMVTVAAGYGFCGDARPPRLWGADHLVETPQALVTLLLSE